MGRTAPNLDLDAAEDGADMPRVDPVTLADDPVRMYLKEIGQVQLLDPDRETWLSSQIAAFNLLADRHRAVRAGNRPLAGTMRYFAVASTAIC